MLSGKPLSIPFFVIYTLCGISDILDGYIARKTKTASKVGEALDSIADLFFIAVILIVFIPLLEWERWMLCWAGTIALTRFLSLGIGLVKYHALPSLHTYANKAAGIALFLFPVLYYAVGLQATVIILCCIAGLSALEELIITIVSKSLDRNVSGIFSNKHNFY